MPPSCVRFRPLRPPAPWQHQHLGGHVPAAQVHGPRLRRGVRRGQGESAARPLLLVSPGDNRLHPSLPARAVGPHHCRVVAARRPRLHPHLGSHRCGRAGQGAAAQEQAAAGQVRADTARQEPRGPEQQGRVQWRHGSKGCHHWHPLLPGRTCWATPPGWSPSPTACCVPWPSQTAPCRPRPMQSRMWTTTSG